MPTRRTGQPRGNGAKKPAAANPAARRKAPGETRKRNAVVEPTNGMPAPDVNLHFVFPSDYGALRDVQRQINSALDAHHYDDESVFAIKLATEEVLINAVKHGNKGDAAKSVTVDVTINRKQFEITVHDQGAGFNRKSVPDPTAEENLDKPSGRGLLLIESYMDSVKYTDKGRRVKMVRKNRAV
jgi:serine/threonine-protein kinase RsbW